MQQPAQAPPPSTSERALPPSAAPKPRARIASPPKPVGRSPTRYGRAPPSTPTNANASVTEVRERAVPPLRLDSISDGQAQLRKRRESKAAVPSVSSSAPPSVRGMDAEKRQVRVRAERG